MSAIWKPSVTVAAIIESNKRFLMVEEETPEGIRINQPAGHLDPGESLEQAVIRETLEETAHDFTPTALIGTYLSRYVSPTGEQVTYLRFAFTGELGQEYNRPLDTGILGTIWMSYNDILHSEHLHRSPLVLQCIDDYLRGKRAPLSLLFTHPSAL
ncbi:NUDIX hydrolase [Undibacterium oligocarboniphilum]|uniref:Phosphatase NudJ n=1 Tax=Undibacterium oligocarboniphilum TaxID=666702 RepID=A0A850QDQ7_9BURK|nr:NUDIX hydrolase [Undibacterium oligocarboniphilum]MBC3869832.1 NUDIX hydrolase [Undibacterium oligocarboniphilum]NVO77448.1 NUDIX hydrolase [Undibacterium oligocarboniphilum]